MIRCRDVHKAYRLGGVRVPALRGVDVDIDGPGFFGIMGASGSGKSTLLHLLAALDTPDSGEIEIAGERIDTMRERDLTRFRRRGVGVVFQQFNLLPTLTARQNVELPALLAGERESWARSRADELLQSLGLSQRANHRPDALSGGEQQRIAIARALLFSPPVLLADEPTGALDSRTSAALWTLLGSIARERSMTVVMVTHEPAAAAQCRRVIVLADGRAAGHFETGGMDAAGVATRAAGMVRTG